MRRKIISLLVAFLLCAPAAQANEDILINVPNAAVVGRGILSYAFWDIYEATLYAPEGRVDAGKPVALSIAYYHAIDGKDIADRSVQEIRDQGFADEVRLAAWHAQLKAIIPNVNKGTVLSAVYTPGRETTFYDGDTAIGTIKGDDFGQLFFNIWLSEKTSEPQLRRALLGMS